MTSSNLGKEEQGSLGRELLRPQEQKLQSKTTNVLKGEEGMGVLSLKLNFSERCNCTGHLCSSGSQDGLRGTNKGHYTHLKALLRIFIQEME